ncbi:unnamed protein product [Callosobruchus maculatus]|uniref:Uncharacterized protein n=1 Tax=Callosobruchus maculatus TaxID=64391 RepID=A0A653CR65_CALMS|nr:unnamed protein product [Callosobruchus maculatus]
MKVLVLLSLVAYCCAVPIDTIYRGDIGYGYPYVKSSVYDHLRHIFGVGRDIYGTGIYGTGVYGDYDYDVTLPHHIYGAIRPHSVYGSSHVYDVDVPHHVYGGIVPHHVYGADLAHHVYGVNYPHVYHAGIHGARVGGVVDDVLRTGVLGGHVPTVAGVVPAVVADINTVSHVVDDDDVDTLHHQQLVQEQQLQIQQQLQQQQLQQQQQLLHEEQRLAQHQLFQEEEDMNRRHFIQQQQLKELQEHVQQHQLKQKAQLDQLQTLHATYPHHYGSVDRLFAGIRTGLPVAAVY